MQNILQIKEEKLFGNYIIATNGAILKDIKHDTYLINMSLLDEQIQGLVDVCKRNNLEYEFMTTKCEVADAKYSYRRVVDPMYDNMGVPFNYQANLEEYIDNLEDSIPLFAINGTEEELATCYEQIASISGLQISGQCIRTTPLKDTEGKLKTLAYYDIMRQGVTKASAIECLARHLEIRKEEIIAVGDGGNDVEMLQTAGLKIAMLNAKPELKAIADIITPVDNNEGGVGRTINAIYNEMVRRESFANKNKPSDKQQSEETYL